MTGEEHLPGGNIVFFVAAVSLYFNKVYRFIHKDVR
jgi:hypothetical protein